MAVAEHKGRTKAASPENGPDKAEDGSTDAVRQDGDGREGPGGADESRPEAIAESVPEEADKSAPGEDDAEARFEELSDRYMRLAADFDNYRRRTRENEKSIREQAAANLIKELLPVIDNLQLALGKGGDGADDGFRQGIQLIEQQLLAALQNHGLQPMETKGLPFDPRFMEAVTQIDGGGETEPGHVVEELRRGYMLHDMVLRAAQVVVAKQD